MRQRLRQAGYGRHAIGRLVAGLGKPDARIYRETLRRGGSTPSEAVHVGGTLINDVQGAQKTGIRAVWLNRLKKPGFDWRQECSRSAVKRTLWTRPLYVCN